MKVQLKKQKQKTQQKLKGYYQKLDAMLKDAKIDGELMADFGIDLKTLKVQQNQFSYR